MTQPAMTQATVASRRPGRWSRAALVVACLALGPLPAAAADDVVIADGAAPQPAAGQGNAAIKLNGVVNVNGAVINANGVRIAGNVNAAGVVVLAGANNNVINQIDQMFFSRGQAVQKREWLESALALQLAELRRSCNLSDAQAKKMALAMQYDVTRFFDDVDQLRDRFAAGGVLDQKMQLEMSPLRLKSQTGELCGPDSFYAKTLTRVLDDEQSSRYRAIIDDRLQRRYLTIIDVALQELEQRCPLDSRQYETIRRLLVAQPCPRSLPNDRTVVLLVTYRVSQIPQEQLQPLFNDRHWEAFDRDRQRFQFYRERLIQNGMLPEE